MYDFPTTLQDGRVTVVVLMQWTRIATTACRRCLAPMDDDLLRRWNLLRLLLKFLLMFGRVGYDQRLLRLLVESWRHLDRGRRMHSRRDVQ